MKNVVRGIADYGNCMGIPTVGGEVEFDKSFDNYCLVDVASIGHGKKNSLIKNKVEKGDIIISSRKFNRKGWDPWGLFCIFKFR